MPNLENFYTTKDRTHVPYIRRAYEYAMLNSEDRKTRVGALIVRDENILTLGTNHYIDGFKDVANDKKYDYIIHAESDAILKAVKLGISTDNATLYAPWFACVDCAKNIIGSGISKIIGHKPLMEQKHERWENNINKALDMLHNSGIELILYGEKVNSRILFQYNIHQV